MKYRIRHWQMEHRSFGRLLSLLEGHLVARGEGKAPDYLLMLDVMHYLTHYPERFHRPAEDGIYALLHERDPALGRAVERLHRAQQRTAAEGGELFELLERINSGGIVVRRVLERRTRAYVRRFRRQIRLEERALLPAARRLLGELEWHRLAPRDLRDPLRESTAAAGEYQAIRAHIAADADGGCVPA